MAHRGRAYPLFPVRLYNGDAPYPNWAARRYRFINPSSTGTYGALANHLVLPDVEGAVTPDGILWEHIEPFGIQLCFIHWEFLIGWNNAVTPSRFVHMQVWVHQLRPGLPAIDLPLAGFGGFLPNDITLRFAILPNSTLYDLSNYDTLEDFQVFAEGY